MPTYRAHFATITRVNIEAHKFFVFVVFPVGGLMVYLRSFIISAPSIIICISCFHLCFFCSPVRVPTRAVGHLSQDKPVQMNAKLKLRIVGVIFYW